MLVSRYSPTRTTGFPAFSIAFVAPASRLLRISADYLKCKEEDRVASRSYPSQKFPADIRILSAGLRQCCEQMVTRSKMIQYSWKLVHCGLVLLVSNFITSAGAVQNFEIMFMSFSFAHDSEPQLPDFRSGKSLFPSCHS